MSEATRTRIARRTGHVLWLLGVALLRLPTTTIAAPPADTSEAVQREIALIEFYGGGSALTPDEKREVADRVGRAIETAPNAEAAADAGAAQLLQVLHNSPPPLIAFARESGRLDAQLHPTVDLALKDQQLTEARIIEARNPVVVFDAQHKRLVTVQTLRVLQQADTFGATLFNVPPPGPDFTVQMQAIIPRAWGNMDTGMQEAMAHAERDLPYARAFVLGISPGILAGFVREWRGKIMAPSDAAAQQLNLAEVMAVVGMTAFRHRQAGHDTPRGALAYRLQLQDLVGRKLQEAVRSYSPACAVTRADVMQNWASCHP